MIHVGDCLDILPTLSAQSVHTCVTSPPYFGLRDYGHAGQIGLEPTPAEFVDALVRVFREVRRVLRDDGTVWLNLGDSYAGSGRGGNPTHPSSTLQGSLATQEASMVKRSRNDVSDAQRATQRQAGVIGRAWVPPPAGLKQKDLIGIPWCVAFALRADGWYLRQDIIWSKPNPMPESVRDRCTKAHEYVFLLSKSERYYFDADAIAEPLAASSIERLSQPRVAEQTSNDRVPGKTNGAMRAVTTPENAARISTARDRYRDQGLPDGPGLTRNKRSVWTVPTTPFKEAHFATFPEALIEPCILAGAPAGGVVLDPFMGAGTTAAVAQRLGRQYIGCELNPDYAEIARKRVAGTNPGLPFGAAA